MTVNHDLQAAEPGKPEPVKKVWGFWATAGFGLIIGIAQSVVGGMVGIGLAIFIFASDLRSGVPLLMDRLMANVGLMVSLVTVAGGVAGVGLMVVLIKARRGISVAEYLGLRRVPGKTLLVWLAVTLVLALLSDSLNIVLGRPIVQESDIQIYNTSIWPPLLWAALVLFGPVYEETMFRGFLFEGFRRSRLGVAGAIVLLALVWSSLHIQYDITGIATIFIMGIAFGLARLKTGSLLVPLSMHALMNLYATLEIAFNVNALVG